MISSIYLSILYEVDYDTSVSEQIIGVRQADRSFYPVIRGMQPVRKAVVLTTTRDAQERAEITLYRGTAEDPEWGEPLTTLVLDNLKAGRQGETDIDLRLTIDENGRLDAVATERSTGNTQSTTISLQEPAYDNPYRVPSSLSDRELYREREREVDTRKKRSWTALRIVLLLLFFALLGVLFYWFLLRDVDQAVTVESITEPVPEETAAPAPPVPTETPEPAPPAEPPEPPVPDDATYQINRGDTLWDISERFYGTPWFFPELADRNRIRNPDLIFADEELVIPEREYLER